ncbi:hypothetical protein ACFRMQ_02075 [Kitasatospora sp. NPDC056783]|uniref:hypothetical protein n=1 Tax=Kitasatospora sp. NPDC056783 TaxID=3345943 RepID=UPI0036AB06A1
MPDKRPSHPYGSLRRERVPDHDGDLEMARHHVTPYNQLKALWNANSTAPEVARTLLLAIDANIDDYSDMSVSARKDNQRVREFCALVANGEVTHDPSGDRHPGWDGFCEIYAWLPGNLFIGPANRADDPGDHFEKDARPIFSSAGGAAPRYELLSLVNAKISEHLTSKTVRSAEEAYGKLAEVATNARYVDFQGCHWTWESDPAELERLNPKVRKPNAGPRIAPGAGS